MTEPENDRVEAYLRSRIVRLRGIGDPLPADDVAGAAVWNTAARE